MSEITDYAVILLVVSGGFVLAVLATKLSDRLPIPSPVLFLAGAALASAASDDIAGAVTIQDVERIAVVALIVILFNGGMDIGWNRMRESIGPVLSIGILGTFLTAGLLTVATHALLGFDWTL